MKTLTALTLTLALCAGAVNAFELERVTLAEVAALAGDLPRPSKAAEVTGNQQDPKDISGDKLVQFGSVCELGQNQADAVNRAAQLLNEPFVRQRTNVNVWTNAGTYTGTYIRAPYRVLGEATVSKISSVSKYNWLACIPVQGGIETLSPLGAAVPGLQVKYRAAGLAEQFAVEQLPTSLYIEGAYGGVKAALRLDMRPGTSPRTPVVAEVAVSGHGSQIGSAPQLAVASIKVYEMGTGRLAATLSDPRPENNFFYAEKRVHSFRFEIPRENLDLAGQYTFVAALSVNGSLAWDVRSEYGKVEIRK